MFGFDNCFAMFDITPVENQFILEYLPGARGDYVKVYLYGLMRCYHPEEDMDLGRMSHELNIPEEDITAAFRYWERRGIVRRISDRPPKWEYINITQKNLTNHSEPPSDPDYEAFCNALYAAFDKERRLHGNELVTCYEWREKLKLPTEVVIMLLSHMIELKGKNVRISEAEKTAVKMAEENVRTVADAEAFFSRNEAFYEGTRKILRKLGKRYAPSEAQVNLYRKWRLTWRFTHEAIEEACEMTAGGDPSMAYLDGILRSLRQEAGDENTALDPELVRESGRRAEGLRAVLKALGSGEVNQENLALYTKMKALYPQNIILTAARECGRSGKGMEDVLQLLNAWKEKGLESEENIAQYVQAFHDQTALIRELRGLWGTERTGIGKTDRSLVSKWENKLGFSRDMILNTAERASGARKPMEYLDRILADYAEKGIRTPEDARKERENAREAGPSGKPSGKSVPAQQYAQRDYSGVQEQLIERQRQEFEAMLNRNGGSSDA